MNSFDTIVLGYGAITSQLMTELSLQSKRILCVTNNKELRMTSVLNEIEFLTPLDAVKRNIEARDAVISWRKIPENPAVLEWLNSSSIDIQRLIHLSSSSVYSEHKGIISELENSEETFNRNSPKRKLEGYLGTVAIKRNVSLSNLRIANAYGSILKTGFISTLVQAIKSNKPIQLNYDLTIKRDYIYISDIVDAVLVILNTLDHYPSVNISTGIAINTEQLLETFESLGHTFSYVDHSREYVVKSCVLEPRILSQLSAWYPRQIAEGLRLTLTKY